MEHQPSCERKEAPAVEIRRANERDVPEILALNQALFEKEKKEFDETLDLSWPQRKGPEYFKSRAESSDGFLEVTESEGQVVGYICGGLTKPVSYREPGIYAELENMIIAEQFRGRGIGSKLINDFLAWCKEKNVDFVAVTAAADNQEAIATYEKAGFRPYTLTLERKLSEKTHE